MKVTFRVSLTQSGHAPKVFQHRKTKAIEPIPPGGESRDWKEIDNPDLRYHATLWPEMPGVTGVLEIDSDDPKLLKMAERITLEV